MCYCTGIVGQGRERIGVSLFSDSGTGEVRHCAGIVEGEDRCVTVLG